MRFLTHRRRSAKAEAKTSVGFFRRRSKRRERLDEDQGRSRGIPFLLLLLWFLFFGTVAYLVFFSAFLRVENIVVSGTSGVSSQAIQSFLTEKITGEYVRFIPKNTLFLLRPAYYEQALLAEFPLLRTAEVSRVFAHGLRAEVSERPKIVLWCSGGPCALLDEEGYMHDSRSAERAEYAQDVLRVIDGSGEPISFGERLLEPRYEFLLALDQEFKSSMDIELEPVFWTPSRFSEEIRVKTKAGWEVYLPLGKSPAESLKALRMLFDTELTAERQAGLKYADLRVENRIYYTLHEESAAGISSEQNEEKQEAETGKKKKKKEKKD